MDEHLPYNEHDDLSLPNEEESWQKMKFLLEKEDKRRWWLPFLFWHYAVGGLLLVGFATGGYLLLRENNPKPSGVSSITGNTEQIRKQPTEQKVKEAASTTSPNTSAIVSPGSGVQKTGSRTNSAQPSFIEKEEQDLAVKASAEKTKKDKAKIPFAEEHLKKVINDKPFREKKIINQSSHQEEAEVKIGSGKTSQLEPSEKNVSASVSRSLKQTVTNAVKDSSSVKDSAKNNVAPPMASTESKKQKSKRKGQLQFSAGIGLEQAITFNGQPASFRDSTGKRKDFFDHIPSVYLRLQKGPWFAQGEFWYRVPQSVKPFSFSQATTYDATNETLLTERLLVQKLYYRQVVFSVNRFVTPNWSWGVGGTYNLLAGAIAERELASKNAVTGNESMAKNFVTVKGHTDSFLYRSTAGILLQTDYHYKRLSIGLRYTKNLQPFIKYITPDGAVMNEKNGVLQAVVRLRLIE